MSERDEQKQRLAQALRANLRRRKAQARATEEAGPTGSEGAGDQPPTSQEQTE